MKAGEQRTFPVQFVRNVRIPMADGLTLAADLHLPAPAAAPCAPVEVWTVRIPPCLPSGRRRGTHTGRLGRGI